MKLLVDGGMERQKSSRGQLPVAKVVAASNQSLQALSLSPHDATKGGPRLTVQSSSTSTTSLSHLYYKAIDYRIRGEEQEREHI